MSAGAMSNWDKMQTNAWHLDSRAVLAILAVWYSWKPEQMTMVARCGGFSAEVGTFTAAPRGLDRLGGS